MRLVLTVLALAALCSCASYSATDPEMLHAKYYLDKEDAMPWLNEAPHNNR